MNLVSAPANDHRLIALVERLFSTTIVISVKRDQTIKLDLDSKILNKFIHKKNQTPNTDRLIDSISQIITNFQAESSELFSILP